MPLRTLLLSLMLPVLAGSALAAGASQPLVVRATVAARTSVQVENAPSRLNVSADDIRRGFVDAEHPITLAVHTNVPSGVMLHFLCAGDQAVQALVEGMGAGLSAAGSPMLLAWQRQPRQLMLRVRFLLSPQARPGSYPWPLRVSAAA